MASGPVRNSVITARRYAVARLSVSCMCSMASPRIMPETAFPRGDGRRTEHDPRVSLDVEEGWRAQMLVGEREQLADLLG
jgi:hypothetical protein